MKLFKTYIAPLLLLWIFFTPTVVKIAHKHETPFHCTAKNEKHFHAHYEKCLICAFQFSFFTTGYKFHESALNETYKGYIFSYEQPFISKSFYLSLLFITFDSLFNILY